MKVTRKSNPEYSHQQQQHSLLPSIIKKNNPYHHSDENAGIAEFNGDDNISKISGDEAEEEDDDDDDGDDMFNESATLNKMSSTAKSFNKK